MEDDSEELRKKIAAAAKGLSARDLIIVAGILADKLRLLGLGEASEGWAE